MKRPLLTAEMIAPWIARSLEAESQEPSGLSLREMERKLIETTFTRCQGNREQTARLLKIGIRTLVRKTSRIRLSAARRAGLQPAACQGGVRSRTD